MLRICLIQTALLWLPWPIRRRLLNRLLGYRIHPEARLGFSIVAPFGCLTMGPGAVVGNLNLARGMDSIWLDRHASIGKLNWIYAIPRSGRYLYDETNRQSELILKEHASLTRGHHVDCSSPIVLGPFSLVAGSGCQLITHSVKMTTGKQQSSPIMIGSRSMVGTRCVVLGGARLPAFSALGANSTLRTSETEEYTVYSGVPAVAVGRLNTDAAFFSRISGHVY